MPLKIEQKIDIWKFSIETQKHFAELSIRMRQLSLAVTGAIIAFASLLYARGDHFPIILFDFEIPIAALLLSVASGLLILARELDAAVYHRMLRGAVKFNEMWEGKIRDEIGWDAGLTETISAYSRFSKPKFEDGTWENSGKKSNAEDRIRRFYTLPAVALFVISAIILFSFQSADIDLQQIDAAPAPVSESGSPEIDN